MANPSPATRWAPTAPLVADDLPTTQQPSGGDRHRNFYGNRDNLPTSGSDRSVQADPETSAALSSQGPNDATRDRALPDPAGGLATAAVIGHSEFAERGGDFNQSESLSAASALWYVPEVCRAVDLPGPPS